MALRRERKKPHNDLDLRSLRYFVGIVDEGTFARAAAKLNVTQPALSRSVQAMELALGAKLLDRGKTGATPTVFGKLLLERGRRLIADADAVVREIALLGTGDLGELSVGAGPYPAEICVSTAAARLLTQRPGIKLRITVGDWPDLTERVLDGRLDLAICDLATAETDPKLRIERLPEHKGRLFCRAGHALATRRSLTMEDVGGFPLALTALPERLAQMFPRGRTLARNVTAPAIHVDTFRLAREIVLQSDAVGAAVEGQITDDVKAGRVVVLPIDVPWLATRYGFIYLAERTVSPSAQLFMAVVRAVESELAAATSPATARARTTATKRKR